MRTAGLTAVLDPLHRMLADAVVQVFAGTKVPLPRERCFVHPSAAQSHAPKPGGPKRPALTPPTPPCLCRDAPENGEFDNHGGLDYHMTVEGSGEGVGGSLCKLCCCFSHCKRSPAPPLGAHLGCSPPMPNSVSRMRSEWPVQRAVLLHSCIG